MVLAIGLLCLGVLARFLPHAANFTPVLALALFGGVYLKRSYALLLPLVLMMLTDLVLGLHPAIFFTWGSVLLISGIGLWLRRSMDPRGMLTGALASALLFFVVTNFGAWLAFYPPTQDGFVSCYVLAVPFFRATLFSTLVYSALLFGGYELLSRLVQKTRLAAVLLK